MFEEEKGKKGEKRGHKLPLQQALIRRLVYAEKLFYIF